MDDWIDVEKAKRVRQELRLLRSQKQGEADLLLEKDAVLRKEMIQLADRISHITYVLNDMEADLDEDLIQHHRIKLPVAEAKPTKGELWAAGDVVYETWVDELVRMGDPFADNPKDSARMTWRAGFEAACRLLLGDEFD